jgi:transposase
MQKIKLTSGQKHELMQLHHATRDKRICDRIKAIIHHSNGWSTHQIAQALLIHETTVTRHINEYLATGKLKPENGGSVGYLSVAQTNALILHLSNNTYRYSYQIIDYISDTWGLSFSVSGLNKWLHQHKFSYKYPKGVPHKFDKELQAQFIEYYKNLKASAGNEPILFMDAMHPTQATKVTCGWIRTGHDKSIETTGSRTRLNIIGAINLNHISSAIVKRYEKVNSEFINLFLEELRLRHDPSTCLHLVLDGAAYHRSNIVKDKAKELNIKLHYLPPYSPNLNPIERLWKVMNEHVRNNKYFSTAQEFREQIDHFFKSKLPEIGDSLSSRINDNFQILNPAS